MHENKVTECLVELLSLLCKLITNKIILNHDSGQGSPEKSTGPPNPASASNKLIITAIAASSLPSVPVAGCSLVAPIIGITPPELPTET